MTRWDGQPGNHACRLLSKHGVFLCSAILQEFQTELEETTRTSSNYVDEDYPVRPEIKQSLTGWGDNCGSESSTLETDVCVWRYAPLVVHATQEEEEEHYTLHYTHYVFSFCIYDWRQYCHVQFNFLGHSMESKGWCGCAKSPYLKPTAHISKILGNQKSQ